LLVEEPNDVGGDQIMGNTLPGLQKDLAIEKLMSCLLVAFKR
jgi:hypothetical protein